MGWQRTGRVRLISSINRGGRELDASLLLMPLVGFLSPNDPRILGTVAAPNLFTTATPRGS
jgi:GH15 family glucan-1,4-alpha-glucosidase